MNRMIRAVVIGLAVLFCAPVPGLRGQDRVYPLDTLHVRAISRLPQIGQSSFRSVRVVDRRELQRLPARSVADVLSRVLGVEVGERSPAQADVSIRGSSFEQVLVLVDGVRVSDEQTGHFDLDLAVPLGAIERIEVLGGPGSATHGSGAAGGVINIVTRRGGHAGAAVHAGSFGAAGGAGEMGVASPAIDVQVAGDYRRSDGHRPGTEFDVYQARGAIARRLQGGRVSMDLGVGVRDFGAADFYAPYPSHERTTSLTSVLRYDPEGGTGWRLAPQISLRRHTDVFTLLREDPSFYRNEHDGLQTGAELVGHYADGGAVRLAAGAEAFRAELESNALGDRVERRAALFTEATIGDPRATALHAGLRADVADHHAAEVSPSIAATHRIGERVRLRASAARGFRAPTWTERFYGDPAHVADPDLRPEHFWSGEVGLRVTASALGSGDVAIFRRTATQLIDWARPVGAPEGTPWRTMNVESAEFTGVEGRLELPRVLGAEPTIRALALSIDAEDADGYVSKYALRQLTRQIGLNLYVPIAAGLAASADVAHARRRQEDGFLRADARLTWSAHPFRLDLDLFNLTDADYLDPTAQPVAGRSAAVRIAWTR